LDEGNEELVVRFIEEFVPKYYDILTDKQRRILDPYVDIDQAVETPIANALDDMSRFLDTYYYTDHENGTQNLNLLQKELLTEMLLADDQEYLDVVDEKSVFEYLYARKDLCEKYGY
jgi:hypothetical protein